MGPRIGRVLTLGSLTLFLFIAAGCGPKAAGRATLTTTIGDREVKASLDGPGFISSKEDAAVISFAGGKLVVEKGAVQLEGAELARLPENAKKVEVEYTAGKLTVTADGKFVVSKEIRK